MFTSNPALLEFLQFTNGRDLPEFVAAREVIERHVKSTANALAPYKHHALKKNVNTKAIIELGHALLSDARLHMNSRRSTICFPPLFKPAGASQIVLANASKDCILYKAKIS